MLAVDDNAKDVAIIEASALLVTLIFIILSFYISNYTQFFTTWEQQCTLNPQQCTWPPWLGALSAQVGTLELFTYYIGFFFVVAASAATIRLLLPWSAWALAGLRIIEFLFFWGGLLLLAFVFFSRVPQDVRFVVLSVITLAMIAGPLAYAYHRRDMPVISP
jgi:hypothetical protein